jgi:hypothetical protein
MDEDEIVTIGSSNVASALSELEDFGRDYRQGKTEG